MIAKIVSSLVKFSIKSLIWILICLCVLFLLITYAGPYIVQQYLQSQEITVNEIDIGLYQTTIKDVEFKQGSVKQISLSYQPIELIKKQIKELEIGEVTLNIAPETFASDSEGGGKLSLGWFIDQINIKNIKGRVALPQTETIALPPVEFKGTLEGTISKVSGPNILSEINLLPSLNVGSGTIKLTLIDESINAEIDIKDFLPPLTSAKFDIQAIGTTDASHFSFTGKVLEENEDFMIIEGQGRPFDTIDIQATIPLLKINPLNKPITKYWTEAPKTLHEFAGDISIDSHLKLANGVVTATGTLDLKNGAFVYEKIIVKDIKTELEIIDVLNVTAKPARVDIAELASPFGKLTNISTDLIIKDGTIKLSKLIANAFDGKINLNQLDAYPLPSKQTIVASVFELSLEKLVENLEVPDLSVKGKIAGKIPIELYDDFSISIEKANVNTLQQGSLSYNWKTALESENSNLQLTARVLKDLNYESIEASIVKPKNKNLSILVRLKGNNPNVLDGRSFDINIDLSGDIVQAILASWDAYQGQQDFWRKQIEKRQ